MKDVIKLIKILLCVLVFLLAIAVTQWVQARGAMYNYSHNFFTHYDPDVTSDYVYNESDSTSNIAGAFGVGAMPYKSIQISLPTLQSTSLSVRIEGQIEDANTWADVYTKSYSSALAIDDLVMITEHLQKIRVGLKVTGDVTTDNVTIRGHFGVLKTR